MLSEQHLPIILVGKLVSAIATNPEDSAIFGRNIKILHDQQVAASFLLVLGPAL
jgi:hypothetical protein